MLQDPYATFKQQYAKVKKIAFIDIIALLKKKQTDTH